MIFLTKIRNGDEPIQIVVEALSYTEAESRSSDIMANIAKDFAEIESIVKTSFKEVINENEHLEASLYFKAKIAIKDVQPNGKMKTTKIPVLVNAEDYSGAFSVLDHHLNGFVAEARLYGFEETEITEYYDSRRIAQMKLKELNIEIEVVGQEVGEYF